MCNTQQINSRGQKRTTFTCFYVKASGGEKEKGNVPIFVVEEIPSASFQHLVESLKLKSRGCCSRDWGALQSILIPRAPKSDLLHSLECDINTKGTL